MKKNKNTANAYTYYEQYNEQYYVYCTRTTYFFPNHLELNCRPFYLNAILLSATPLNVIPSHQYFH